MDTERKVAEHYGRAGLEEAILKGVRESGKDPDRLTPSDLSAVDEFHLGWRAQTIALGRELGLEPGMHVIDLGSGIGGPARTFADVYGCRVTGIDLTPGFVEVAKALTRRCGLSDRVAFEQGSALALPFAEASFDAASLIHVGMNIADKGRLFAEARRVLRKGAPFAVYDITRKGEAEIPYPVPWAETPETSFVQPPGKYREQLEAAGFEVERERDRTAFVLELAREMREYAEKHGAPALGLHVIMGPAAAKERLGNVMSALNGGVIAPVELIARAV